LFVVKEDQSLAIRMGDINKLRKHDDSEESEYSWMDLLRRGLVEYIDTEVLYLPRYIGCVELTSVWIFLLSMYTVFDDITALHCAACYFTTVSPH
jgi:hypothetical protein